MSTGGNSILVTSEIKTSTFTRYAEKGWMFNKELSDLVGVKVWTGYWR